MGIDALVLSHNIESADETFFTSLFLKSNDFDNVTLKNIAQDINLSPPTRADRSWLAEAITGLSYQNTHVQRVIINHLLKRGRKWITFQLGSSRSLPELLDPVALVSSLGEEHWYGPIRDPDVEEVYWYIRPSFAPHWEILPGANSPQESTIRWLCFARFSNATISLHWNGFSYSDDVEKADNKNVQFPYWQFIPNYFDEILGATRANTINVDLHSLILHSVWNYYRYNPAYIWIDKRIRAESGGVALNAHAGTVQELSIQGIRGLANTLRRSIQSDLFARFGTSLPEPDTFDEVILRTLLREYGTLSYEFALESETGDKIFRSHCYFGQKPNFNSPDSFPHLRVFTTWQSDTDVLEFLLSHTESDGNSDDKPRQATLFGL